MNVDATIPMTVTGVKLKTREDGTYMLIDASVMADEKHHEGYFGEEFAHSLFGSRHETVEPGPNGDATVTRHGFKSAKPAPWMKMAEHRCDLWGHKADVQPTVKDFRAADDWRFMEVLLELEVKVGKDPKLIGHLGCKMDQSVRVGMKPKVIPMALKNRQKAPPPEKKDAPQDVAKVAADEAKKTRAKKTKKKAPRKKKAKKKTAT